MKRTKCCGRGGRRGFTLIELLAVMGIIIILLGLVMGLSAIAGKNASVAKAKADVQRLAQAIEEYKLDAGVLPATMSSATLSRYMPNLNFTDPWYNAYQYTLQGKSFLVLSMGPDGRTGQTDGDGDGKWDFLDDISNRKAD